MKYLLLYIKGLAIGAVDLVPGVSGGTIAFITGIYEELLYSLRSLTPKNFKLFFVGKFREFWKAINGSFLLVLALGIATSILSLVKVVKYMLNDHPIITWSFFFGLIAISTISILKTIRKFEFPMYICFGVGAVIAYMVTVMSPAQTPNDLWFIFLCGMIAICALLLPGTSGSFMLLMMSKYYYIIDAIDFQDFKFDIVIVFICGAVTGLLSFSHFLSWLLRKYHDITISLLAGFLFGSLNKVWPWKVQIDTFTNEILGAWNMKRFENTKIILAESNYLPNTFETVTGDDAKLFWGLLSAALAITIYLTLEYIARKKRVTK